MSESERLGMNQLVKVCCFCESWESGGIESFLCNVLCRMDPAKVQADVVVSCMKKSIFTEKMQAHGVRFYELSGRQRSVLENGRLFYRILKEQKYDVVHFNLFQALSLRYVYLAKKAGIPVRIVHSHNTALRNSVTKPIKLCIHNIAKERFARYATDLWACSSQAATFLFPRWAVKSFRWIPNGIQTEKFRFDAAIRKKVRNELGLTNLFVIGNIGRLCYQKNQAFLLNVFAEVLKQKPESRLLLVGAGDRETTLRAKAKQLCIEDKVIFYGVSTHPEELLWAMDIFAFPSLFEGLGIVAVEAQAAGLPVICSEYVPKEAYVTSFAYRVSIKKGAKAWAEMCISAQLNVDRKAGCCFVKEAGFQIDDSAKIIQEEYIRMLEHEAIDFSYRTCL